jgi:hypothetical protein
VEYVPATQAMHRAVPVVFLYVPTAHVEHMPSGPVYPALQTGLIQAHLDELAMGEMKSAGHARHVVAGTVEYVPAKQDVHAAEPVVAL